MNIFVLDEEPKVAAKYHCDKHVVKMILETAQLLSSAVRYNAPNLKDDFVYRETHKNHPCTIWTRTSQKNFIWLYNLGIALCEEYTYRYGKTHKSLDIIKQCFHYIELIPNVPKTPFAQAMPPEYKDKNAVMAYRDYYKNAKKNMLVYTKRSAPTWLDA